MNIFNFLKKSIGWQNIFTSTNASTKYSNSELLFGTIWACEDAIASAVSNVEYGLFRGDTSVDNHPAIKLFKQPDSIKTDRDLLYLISTHIDTFGQAFLYPVGSLLNNSKVVELKILEPNKIKTIIDDNGDVVRYRYINNGKVTGFEPNELINILRPHPLYPYIGMSTIEMARFEGGNDRDAIELNSAFYQNGGLPSGVLSTDVQMGKETFNKLKSRIKAQYEGAKNAWKIMFLTHGLKYSSVAPTQRDMQYIEQRGFNRDQIISIFRVPKSLLAISDNVNKATAFAETEMFYKNTVVPRLRFIFDKLNRFYLSRFPSSNGLEFKFKNPTPKDEEAQIAKWSSAVGVWMTVNEVRVEQGLDPINGGDELWTVEPQPEPQKHLHKEEHPDPNKFRGSKKKHIERRVRYLSLKEIRLRYKLEQHFNTLIRDIKKNKSFDNPDQTPEALFEQIMPDRKKRQQWVAILTLLLFKNLKQVSQTAIKHLKEAYGFEEPTSISGLLMKRATFASKSVNDTLMKQIRKTIKDNVESGNVDLNSLTREVVKTVNGIKKSKAEMIARTELSNAYSETQFATYRDNGIKKIEWVAGANSCEVCRQNNGKIVRVGELFPSGHMAEPVHPNCVCITVPVREV